MVTVNETRKPLSVTREDGATLTVNARAGHAHKNYDQWAECAFLRAEATTHRRDRTGRSS